MEQQEAAAPTPTPSTTTTTSQPTEPQPPPQPPPQQPQEQTPPPTSSTPAAATIKTTPPPTTNTANPNPNPNPSSKPTGLSPPPPRPAPFSRPWQQPPTPPPPQQQHFSHFSSLPSTSSSSSSASPSPSASSPIPGAPRGGIAIGVPAPRPSASSPQPAPPFSSAFGQQYGGLASNSVSTSSPLQVRPGMQGMGVMGSLGSSSQMRPGGISVQHHQQRPVQQSPIRPPPPSPSSQSPATQNFQGQGLMRVPSVGSPGSPSPSTSQGVQSFNQPWLSSGSQGKPPLPPPSSYRPQMNTPSMQQRSHIPQQHSPLSTTSQQQHVSSVQPQQSKPAHQLPEHYGQQFSSSRVPQSLPHQQQITRPQGSAIQKPSSLVSVQPNTVQPGNQSKIASVESDEFGNRILSKRSIHELVNQIDPSERLDPEVEDILVDIAEDFVESITTFGCSLAKHRKSDTLEAKDILLHLERNWNMALPGFISGDEIKTYKKPLTSDIHKERLAAIKKSVMATEVASAKTSVGQAAVNSKGNPGKISASIVLHESF